MVANIDPVKARLYPELLPEAMCITASESGAVIASYAGFSPYMVELVDITTSQVPGGDFRLDIDSGYAVIESPLESRPDRKPVKVDLLCEDSMDLWALCSADHELEQYYSYTMRCGMPTLFQKIKYNMDMTDAEIALAEQLDIDRKYEAGILQTETKPKFRHEYEVAKQITVTAGLNTRVGRLLNVKKGEKLVITSLSVDRDAIDAACGGPGSTDTYLTINRDVRDLQYVHLDCLAMPSIHDSIECYIPAIDTMEVLIESTTGVTDLPVRFTYGVAPITIIEKIRWGLALTEEENQTALDYDLHNSVQAGVF